MKTTAVEWLVSKLNPYGLSESQTLVFEQALEIEKTQIGYNELEVLELLQDFEKEKSTKVIFAKTWFNKYKKK
jgi:hypothetical protein